MNNDKKLVNSIAKKDYRKNYKDNIVLCVAIALTTFLLTGMFGLGISYRNSLVRRSIEMEGLLYDVQLPEPTDVQIELAKKSSLIKCAGQKLKCSIINGYDNKKCDEVRLYWVAEESWNNQLLPAVELFEGKYPEAEDEIVLSMTALKKMGINSPQVGMLLKDVSYYDLAQDHNGIEDMHLCGILKDSSRESKGFISEKFKNRSGAKMTDLSEGILNITLKHHIYTSKEIEELSNQLNVSDDQIIYADLNMHTDYVRTCVAIGCFVIIILASGYLFIKNTITLSIGKKIRFWGQLKSIGFVNEQIKKIYLFSIMRDTGSGIVIGVLGGLTVINGLVPLLLSNLNVESQKLSFPLEIMIIILGVAFSILVIIICTRKSYEFLKELTAIEASRYTKAGKVHRVNKRNPKTILLFHRNVVRDKKQFVIITLSLGLSLLSFYIANDVININSAKTILNNAFYYDFRIKDDTTVSENQEFLIDDELISRIKEIDNVDDVWRVTSAKAVIPYNEELMKEYYEEYYALPIIQGDFEKQIKEYKNNPKDKKFLGHVIGIDKAEFDYYNKQLEQEINWDEFKSGKKAIICGSVGISVDNSYGKEITFSIDGEEYHSIIIGGDSSNCLGPNYYAAGDGLDIIVSNEYMESINPKTHTELIDVQYKKSFDKKTDKKIKRLVQNENLFCNSKMSDYDDLKSSEEKVVVIGILIIGLLLIIALINYTNVSVASVTSRTKELYIMKCLGMTSKQMKRMITLEGLEYGTIAILVSTIANIPIRKIVYLFFNKYSAKYKPVCWKDIIGMICIMCLCVLVSKFVYGRLIQDRNK